MGKFVYFALFGLIATVFALTPDMAFAQAASVGQNVGQDIAFLVRGNIGTIIGLLLALLGLYTWLVEQSSWGIVMIIGGVAITAFPGIFNSLKSGFENAFTETVSTEQHTLDADLGGDTN